MISDPLSDEVAALYKETDRILQTQRSEMPLLSTDNPRYLALVNLLRVRDQLLVCRILLDEDAASLPLPRFSPRFYASAALLLAICLVAWFAFVALTILTIQAIT